MGLFDKHLSVFSRKPTPAAIAAITSDREPARPVALPPARPPSLEMTVTVSFSGPVGYVYPVSEEAVDHAMDGYNYVFEREFAPLKAADRWWDEARQARRLRERSDKALAWATPFVPLEVAAHEGFRGFREFGPLGASGISKELRAVIREKRKTKEPHEQLLRALYGVAIIADIVAALDFEGVQPHALVQYVDISELRAMQLDYAELGYRHVSALGKTDVKWLVEAFGEPAGHVAFDDKWPAIRRNAVARFCWGDLGVSAQGASLSQRAQLMRRYVELRVRSQLKYRGEPGSGPPPGAQPPIVRRPWIEVLPFDHAATKGAFVVADLETTGLSPNSDEILEFGAVLVEPNGKMVREFAMLVKSSRPVPPEITRLTGITQTEVDADGSPLERAYDAFANFIADYPVFFHNAPFDLAFIARASARTGAKFENPVYDTLPLARAAWPALRDHKLRTLALHVGYAEPQHRALGDAKAALAVLLAARQAR